MRVNVGVVDGGVQQKIGSVVMVLVLLGTGCKRSTAALDKATGSAPSPAVTQKAPVSARPKLDTEKLRRFVERWQQAQNDGKMEQYREIYAQDFAGLKRVGGRAIEMGRDAWLQDRHKLSLKTPRIEISDLRFYRNRELVIAEFHQRWATKNFADEGTKVLTLRARSGSWEILREAMLESRALSAEERAKAPQVSGHCERLGQDIEQRGGAGELWRFADIGGEVGPVKWAHVSSWKEAESKTPYGSVWSSATVVSDGNWLLALTSSFSPSGDSGLVTTQCYRPDGTLARLEDAFRTFHTGRGLAEDVRVTAFDEKGNVGWTTRQTYLMESGEALDPAEIVRPINSTPSKRVSTLPFFALLPNAVRRRY
jgi:hypothetical protein